MGASNFQVTVEGKTAREAFESAVASAQWEFGHGGYTGTIAEKSSFKVLSVPEGLSGQEFINLIMWSDGDLSDVPEKFKTAVCLAQKVVDDKWGPAGCVAAGDGRWTFFGWASD